MSDRTPGKRPPPEDRRALSVTINYTFALVITTMVVSGLFMGMNTLLQAQREEAIDSEFLVLGNRIAADLAAADRLAQSVSGANAHVEVETPVPNTVAGVPYVVTITSSGVDGPDGDANPDYYLVDVHLEADRPRVNRTVTVKTVTKVAYSQLSGGAYVIVYDPDAPPTGLEVKNG